MTQEFKIGDLVNYHSIIGRPATSFNHKLLKLDVDESGEPIAWIKGKAGYVSQSALSLVKEIESTFKSEKLTPENFDDFKSRMINDCRGDLVKEHATANALFIVQQKKQIIGLDLSYCDDSQTAVQFGDDADFIPFENLIESLDEDSLEEFDAFIKSEYGTDWSASDFHELHSVEDTLYNYSKKAGFCIVVTGYAEEWQFLNAHFTNDSAENYIEQHGHKHEGELRVFVDSMYRCNEINLIRDAIMDGNLVFKGE